MQLRQEPDIPVPPEHDPTEPVKEPPGTPQTDPPGPVREPEPTGPRRLNGRALRDTFVSFV